MQELRSPAPPQCIARVVMHHVLFLTLGAQVLVVPCDVTQDEQVAAMAHRALEDWGAPDLLVNNAAIQPPASCVPLHELPDGLWQLSPASVSKTAGSRQEVLELLAELQSLSGEALASIYTGSSWIPLSATIKPSSASSPGATCRRASRMHLCIDARMHHSLFLSAVWVLVRKFYPPRTAHMHVVA